MRLLRNSVHVVLVLAAMAVALAPKAVFADRDRNVPITGTFTVSTVSPSAVDYCASDSTPIEFRGGTPIEFRGIGNISKLGPLFLTVKKCATVIGGVQTFAGTFTMTAGNGDTLIGDVRRNASWFAGEWRRTISGQVHGYRGNGPLQRRERGSQLDGCHTSIHTDGIRCGILFGPGTYVVSREALARVNIAGP